jgi:hypothetical protein
MDLVYRIDPIENVGDNHNPICRSGIGVKVVIVPGGSSLRIWWQGSDHHCGLK